MDNFTLEKAFFLLQHGYILHIAADHGGGEIWENNGFFQYRYFGQSAIKPTKERLQWLFENIFKCWRFTVFSNWGDVDLSYQCNNDRALWLFTDGQYTGYNAKQGV